MIHIIKNNKWVIATSLVCILLGVLTFFTFINQSFIKLTDSNLQKLLIADILILITFFCVIANKIYNIFDKNYALSITDFFQFELDWCFNAYNNFKDYDKFLILLYINLLK